MPKLIKPRMTAGEPRKSDEKDQRVRILESAAKLFANKGYEEASLNDIAADVKLSKAALYHYFSGKDEIIEEITMTTLENLRRYVDSAVDESQPAAARLSQAMDLHAKFFEENFWAFTAMLMGFGGIRSVNLRARAVELRETHENMFRRIIRDGVKSGEFVDIDPALTARAALSLLSWMARWYKPGGKNHAHEIASEFCNLLLFGIVGKPRNPVRNRSVSIPKGQ